jgi:hypothetical protein
MLLLSGVLAKKLETLFADEQGVTQQADPSSLG